MYCSTTYLAANTIDSVCEWRQANARLPKFLGVTPVNMTLVICKDVAFAKLFREHGTSGAAAHPLAVAVRCA